MQLEWHQLDMGFESLRPKCPRRERSILGSLSEIGQQLPVVVIAVEAIDRYQLIDGYKRVRALRRLGQDSVVATLWQLDAPSALLLERFLRRGDDESAIEQGWLLKTLRERFGYSLEELCRRFEKSKSWVSRRLGLVEELPETVQALVRDGSIPPYAAMKFFLPLARANIAHTEALAKAISGLGLSARRIEALYMAYRQGDDAVKERIVSSPALFLRVDEALSDEADKTPELMLERDLEIIYGIALRQSRAVRDEGALRALGCEARKRLSGSIVQAKYQTQLLFRIAEKELSHARPEHAPNDSASA